jgi:hypothetical protein
VGAAEKLNQIWNVLTGALPVGTFFFAGACFLEDIAEIPFIPAKLWFPFCILWCIIRDNIHSGGLSALAEFALPNQI